MSKWKKEEEKKNWWQRNGGVVIALTVLVLFLIFMGHSFDSVAISNEKLMEESGILGEHKLVAVQRYDNQVSGDLQGSFFIGIGSIEGKMRTDSMIQFKWERITDNELVIIPSQLRWDQFQFIPDDTKTTPTIEFIFDDFWKMYDLEDEIVNPNLLIYDSVFQIAKVRLNNVQYQEVMSMTDF